MSTFSLLAWCLFAHVDSRTLMSVRPRVLAPLCLFVLVFSRPGVSSCLVQVTKLLLSMDKEGEYKVDLEDTAVRSMCIVDGGSPLGTPTRPQPCPVMAQPQQGVIPHQVLLV